MSINSIAALQPSISVYLQWELFPKIKMSPVVVFGVLSRLRRFMLAKSWNCAFMDSRIMLAKPSYYAWAHADAYSLHSYLQSLKVWKISVPFLYLQVTISTTKMHTGKYPHTKVSMHARDQHGKEKTLLLLHDLYSLIDFFWKKDFFVAKLVGVTCTFENYHVQLSS